MSKLKVAILEDNKLLLKDLKENLENSGLVEVVAYALDTEELFDKIKSCTPEALILDIDIGSDSMNGLDVASKLQLPVLFVSGKTRDFFLNIEELNANSENIVEHLTKPITLNKLNKTLPKFIKQIRLMDSTQFVYLDFLSSKRNKIAVSDIVFLETNKEHGSKSNNKRIYFTEREPETLVDFSFRTMKSMGLSENQFITIHKSFRVNMAHIMKYENASHQIVVKATDDQGAKKEFPLPVSINYQKHIRNVGK